MKNACFTGHRKISGDLSVLRKDLYLKLERAINNGGIVNFYAGGSISFDTIAAETVIRLRGIYPQVTLNLVLPCCSEDQTKKWSDEHRETFYRIKDNTDTVEYTAERYYPGCMKVRNKRLVELADFCFCYWDGRKTGGTYQTIGFALEKGIDVWNFYNSVLIKAL